MLSETVNPSNGSLSIRIQVPTAKGRGITLPFSFGYDSNVLHHLKPGFYPYYGTAYWVSNTGGLAQGGWSYEVPQLNLDDWSQNTAVLTGINTYTIYTCQYDSAYVFRDGSGGVHALGVSTDWVSNSQAAQYCGGGGQGSGGDAQVRALLTTPSPNGPSGQSLPSPVAVYDASGTIYYFPFLASGGSTDTTSYALPSYIEDRNGNTIKISGSTFTDTAGRAALSWSGFGPTGTTNTVSVSGLSYQVTWKTISANFSTPSAWAGQPGWPNTTYDNCTPVPQVNDSQTVVSKIKLPNGQQYKFYYGADNPNSAYNNPYGLLSEIDYPSGGWVRYKWKLSDTMNEIADYPGEYDAGSVVHPSKLDSWGHV